MPPKNALATARLDFAKKRPAGTYRVTLQVWSHSYDHPDPARRSAMVTGVYLAQSAPTSGYALANVKITDRYGVDHTGLWVRTMGLEVGFEGYTEYDNGGACGPKLPNVLWGAYTGIYDERCLTDPACDAMRLQTYRVATPQIAVYNYLLGPVTFVFDVALASVPSMVRLRFGHIGGNSGNPAQRSATLPDETFVIQWP